MDDEEDIRLRDLPRLAPWWVKAAVVAWLIFVVAGSALLTAALVAHHH